MNIVKQEEQKPILSCSRASQRTFCSIQAIKGFDEAHPHWEGSVPSTQSANSNVSLIQKHPVNNVWPNTWHFMYQPNWYTKFTITQKDVQQLDSWSLGTKVNSPHLALSLVVNWSFQFVSSQKPWASLTLFSSSHTSQTTCQKILFTYKTHSEFNHSWSLSLLIAQWELPSLLMGTYVDITCQIAATSLLLCFAPILSPFIYHIISLFVLPVIFLCRW